MFTLRRSIIASGGLATSTRVVLVVLVLVFLQSRELLFSLSSRSGLPMLQQTATKTAPETAKNDTRTIRTTPLLAISPPGTIVDRLRVTHLLSQCPVANPSAHIQYSLIL